MSWDALEDTLSDAVDEQYAELFTHQPQKKGGPNDEPAIDPSRPVKEFTAIWSGRFDMAPALGRTSEARGAMLASTETAQTKPYISFDEREGVAIEKDDELLRQKTSVVYRADHVEPDGQGRIVVNLSRKRMA